MEEEIDSIEPAKPVQRLCSEIQLFDLCDLDRCRYKEGRFCTQAQLLARFEWIADKEENSKVTYLDVEGEFEEDEEQGGEEDFLGAYGFSEDKGERWDDD